MRKRHWNSDAELMDAIAMQALGGRNTVLSPQTALHLVTLLRQSAPRPYEPKNEKWNIDLYSKGSCIYRLLDSGDIDQIDAWARSSLIANRAREALKTAYPSTRFEQRRRSFVEGD